MISTKLEKGSVWLLSGHCQMRVASGAVEVIGSRMAKEKELVVPAGKRIPVETLEDADLELIFGEGGKIDRLPGRTIPDFWDDVVKKVAGSKAKTVLVLGEMDTGKTFFSTYLANRLLQTGRRISVLDADTGQSDIGPPGTLGLAVLAAPVVFLGDLTPTAVYFTGAHSPGLHFLSSLVGVGRLRDRALSLSDLVIIDTPGWVQGDGGRALRRAEMDLLSPDFVILMQRQSELEHLVKPLPPENVIRVTVSKKASATSPAERKGLREILSQKYFREARPMKLSFKDIATDRCYLLSGQEIKLKEADVLWAERLSGYEGILAVTERPLSQEAISKIKNEHFLNSVRNILTGQELGLEAALLSKEGDVLGLAIVKSIDYRERQFNLHTPVLDKKTVKVIQFGSLRLTLDGREAGFVEPGYF